MIRKPPASAPSRESPAVRTIQTAAGAFNGGVKVVRTGGHVARGLFCFFFAALWGFAALAGGLFAGSLPTFIGVGAMAAFMAWAGRRAFAKAAAISSGEDAMDFGASSISSRGQLGRKFT
jgi:hypothetical protein